MMDGAAAARVKSGPLESELFGHVKGAFTGALRDHRPECLNDSLWPSLQIARGSGVNPEHSHDFIPATDTCEAA